MDKETKQMFELMLSKFDEITKEIQSVRTDLTSEIGDLRDEMTSEIKSLKLQTESNSLEIRSIRLQMEHNQHEMKTEFNKIHKKLDAITNQVAKSAEDITGIRNDNEKKLPDN